jgi:hypothetical protein
LNSPFASEHHKHFGSLPIIRAVEGLKGTACLSLFVFVSSIECFFFFLLQETRCCC